MLSRSSRGLASASRGAASLLASRPSALALGRVAPAALATKPLNFERRHERQLSSQAPLSLPGGPKMGTLAVDPLAGSSTVQGVEYVLTGFDKLVNWARKSSLWPMTFGLA